MPHSATSMPTTATQTSTVGATNRHEQPRRDAALEKSLRNFFSLGTAPSVLGGSSAKHGLDERAVLTTVLAYDATRLDYTTLHYTTLHYYYCKQQVTVSNTCRFSVTLSDTPCNNYRFSSSEGER